MTAKEYEVSWTREAVRLLRALRGKPLRRAVLDESDSLAGDPFAGKRLQGELEGYWSLRVARERYRELYRVDADDRRIYIVHLGRRKAGRADDVYELARKLIEARLLPPARRK